MTLDHVLEEEFWMVVYKKYAQAVALGPGSQYGQDLEVLSLGLWIDPDWWDNNNMEKEIPFAFLPNEHKKNLIKNPCPW